MIEAAQLKSRASGLTAVVGVIFIAIGLFELTNYYYQKPANFFEIFFYAFIGIGLFEKHAWSRTLLPSALTILSGVYFLIMNGEVTWNGSPVGWGNSFVFTTIIVHVSILFVLLRNEVKNQFIEKEIKYHP